MKCKTRVSTEEALRAVFFVYLSAFYYTLDAEAVVESAMAYIYEKLMAETSSRIFPA